MAEATATVSQACSPKCQELKKHGGTARSRDDDGRVVSIGSHRAVGGQKCGTVYSLNNRGAAGTDDHVCRCHVGTVLQPQQTATFTGAAQPQLCDRPDE